MTITFGSPTYNGCSTSDVHKLILNRLICRDLGRNARINKFLNSAARSLIKERKIYADLAVKLSKFETVHKEQGFLWNLRFLQLTPLDPVTISLGKLHANALEIKANYPDRIPKEFVKRAHEGIASSQSIMRDKKWRKIKAIPGDSYRAIKKIKIRNLITVIYVCFIFAIVFRMYYKHYIECGTRKRCFYYNLCQKPVFTLCDPNRADLHTLIWCKGEWKKL